MGVCDVNGQQIDTRRTNSWLLKLDEVRQLGMCVHTSPDALILIILTLILTLTLTLTLTR